MSIGQRIKTIRTKQGISIDDLAYRLGKNRTTVYRYEKGDIENLPLSILDSLAKALNTTPAYLMGWENSNSICHGHENIIPSVDAPEIKYFSEWFTEYGFNQLTDEECKKVIEYTKFLLSMRNK